MTGTPDNHFNTPDDLAQAIDHVTKAREHFRDYADAFYGVEPDDTILERFEKYKRARSDERFLQHDSVQGALSALLNAMEALDECRWHYHKKEDDSNG